MSGARGRPAPPFLLRNDAAARPTPLACPICLGRGYVLLARLAIDACLGCTRAGEAAWRLRHARAGGATGRRAA